MSRNRTICTGTEIHPSVIVRYVPTSKFQIADLADSSYRGWMKAQRVAMC